MKNSKNKHNNNNNKQIKIEESKVKKQNCMVLYQATWKLWISRYVILMR